MENIIIISYETQNDPTTVALFLLHFGRQVVYSLLLLAILLLVFRILISFYFPCHFPPFCISFS